MSENNILLKILKKLEELEIIDIINDDPIINNEILIEQKANITNKENQRNEITSKEDNSEVDSNENITIEIKEKNLILREKKLELKEIKYELVNHKIFKHIKTIEQLRTFMECHVFAVWDFMSLIKRLQIDLTCVELPWMPNKNAKIARLINEIVMGEETDELPNKNGYISHFELYLLAMEEIKANPEDMNKFISNMNSNKNIKESISHVNEEIQNFVLYTIETAKNGTLYDVLGSFFYGRENVIPEMFDNLLNSWDISEKDAPMFVYYLKRHIELDSGEHGPAAEKIIEILTENNHEKQMMVLNSAINAIKMRIKLWDAILKLIK